MKHLATYLSVVFLSILCADVKAQTASAVTEREVLVMMANVPGRPGDPRSVAYRWDKKKSAGKVAAAVVAAAPSRQWAARMVVHGIHESGLELCAEGDSGKSLGVWQLQGVPREVACDPMKAAPVWLHKAMQSMEDCAKVNLPEPEQLAELMSGSCSRGRLLARRREVLMLGALAGDHPAAVE